MCMYYVYEHIWMTLLWSEIWKWVMTPVWLCHGTRMGCVMAHVRMSHGTHINELWRTYEWVMSHTWMSHGTHMNESWHTVCFGPVKSICTFVGLSHTGANTHVRGIQSYVCQYACSWDSVTCVPIRMFVGFSHVCQYVCANTHVRGIQSYVCQYYVPILRETDMSVRLCANTHVRENQSYVRQYSVRHVSQCDGSESNVRATRMSVSWRTWS